MTILGTCEYVMPLDLWAGDGHPAVCLSVSGGNGRPCSPTPELLEDARAARDSSGLRALWGLGPPLGPEDTNSALWKEGRGDQHCHQLSTCTALHRGSASFVTSSTTPTGLCVSLVSPLRSSRPAPLRQGLIRSPSFISGSPPYPQRRGKWRQGLGERAGLDEAGSFTVGLPPPVGRDSSPLLPPPHSHPYPLPPGHRAISNLCQARKQLSPGTDSPFDLQPGASDTWPHSSPSSA